MRPVKNVDSNIIINIRTRPGLWDGLGMEQLGMEQLGMEQLGMEYGDGITGDGTTGDGTPKISIYGFYNPYFSNAWSVHNGGYSYFGPNRGPSYALINVTKSIVH